MHRLARVTGLSCVAGGLCAVRTCAARLVLNPHRLPPACLLSCPCLLLQLKLIDFGAACDLSTGINFNPEYGMLDPRYSGATECCAAVLLL